MIVWSGSGNVTGWGDYLNDGASYDPQTDSWAPLPAIGAPAARMIATAQWTGSEWIVWGGWSGANPGNSGELSSGGRLGEYHLIFFPFLVEADILH